MKATVDAWIRANPKTAEWHDHTARRAKEIARNYSRLLYLYLQNSPASGLFSIINARKAVVRWERKSDPVYPIAPDSILDEDSKTGVASQGRG
jgi:hypothetical protein